MKVLLKRSKQRHDPPMLPLFWFLLGCFLLSTAWSDDTTQPQQQPESLPFRLSGVNYDIRDGPDWLTVETGRCKSYDRVVNELQQLKDQVTDRVRIFTMTDCDTAYTVLRAVQQLQGDGMSVWLGIWASEVPAVFEQERARLLELLQNENGLFDSVIGVHVSSEAVYRNEITVTEAIQLRNTIKEDLVTAGYENLPVTVADIIDTNLANPELVAVDDNVFTFNQFPSWETSTDINGAAQYMSSRVALLDYLVGGRQIIITETGWPDAGQNENANPANPPSMRKWLRDFFCLAESSGWQYFWFNAYDNDWRRINDGILDDVEGHFGLFDEAGILKTHIASLVIDCEQSAYSIDANGSTTAPVDVPTLTPVPEPTADEEGNTPTLDPAINETSVPNAGELNTSPAPASSPTQAPADLIPTMGPTVSPMIEDDTQEPSSNPTVAPGQTATVQPFAPTTAPINATPEPSPAPAELPTQQCRANSACPKNPQDESQLCCPTSDGLSLSCCDNNAGVVAACSGNPQCDALEIPGFCCPTSDNRYLDCCKVYPVECLQEDGCTVFSAVQWKLLQGSMDSQSPQSNRAITCLTTAGIVSLLTMVLL